jgi:hypothetical protein
MHGLSASQTVLRPNLPKLQVFQSLTLIINLDEREILVLAPRIAVMTCTDPNNTALRNNNYGLEQLHGHVFGAK